ncbi:unnamed protein product [Prunus armeniaca]|uniref:Uncharacterized protein n=1 Tax=Prunus armeniaca TaxID=36596 RepID=A0A6J5U001_PRUAR|nr:unnamed protein product [Prunus armeniaca]
MTVAVVDFSSSQRCHVGLFPISGLPLFHHNGAVRPSLILGLIFAGLGVSIFRPKQVPDAEIVDVDEVDHLPVSPLREERPSESECQGTISETAAPAETECPLVVGEVRLEETTCEEGPLEDVTAENSTEVVVEALALELGSMDFERESSVLDPKEAEMPEIENAMPEPTVDPIDHAEASQYSGSPHAEKHKVPTMSKERAKLVLAKWVTLSTEERVGDEQKSKVCDALDVLSPSYPDFASSFETAKLDLLTLAGKFQHSDAAPFPDDEVPLEAKLVRSREEMKVQHEELEKCELLWKQTDWRLRTSEAHLQQVLLQKEEFQDEADQMLTALTTAKEDIDKAEMDVGLEIW